MADETPNAKGPDAADPDERAGDFERYALIAALTLVVLCLLVWDKWQGDAARPAPSTRPDRTLRVEIGGGTPSAAPPVEPAPPPRVAADPPPAPQPPPAPAPRTYVVKSGDTLYDIAKRELGSSGRVKDIVDLNAIADGSKLKPGQVLTLPAK